MTLKFIDCVRDMDNGDLYYTVNGFGHGKRLPKKIEKEYKDLMAKNQNIIPVASFTKWRLEGDYERINTRTNN